MNRRITTKLAGLHSKTGLLKQPGLQEKTASGAEGTVKRPGGAAAEPAKAVPRGITSSLPVPPGIPARTSDAKRVVGLLAGFRIATGSFAKALVARISAVRNPRLRAILARFAARAPMVRGQLTRTAAVKNQVVSVPLPGIKAGGTPGAPTGGTQGPATVIPVVPAGFAPGAKKPEPTQGAAPSTVANQPERTPAVAPATGASKPEAPSEVAAVTLAETAKAPGLVGPLPGTAQPAPDFEQDLHQGFSYRFTAGLVPPLKNVATTDSRALGALVIGDSPPDSASGIPDFVRDRAAEKLSWPSPDKAGQAKADLERLLTLGDKIANPTERGSYYASLAIIAADGDKKYGTLAELAARVGQKPVLKGPGAPDGDTLLKDLVMQAAGVLPVFQGVGTDTCGAASASALMRQNDPVAFVRLATGLAFDGKGVGADGTVIELVEPLAYSTPPIQAEAFGSANLANQVSAVASGSGTAPADPVRAALATLQQAAADAGRFDGRTALEAMMQESLMVDARQAAPGDSGESDSDESASGGGRGAGRSVSGGGRKSARSVSGAGRTSARSVSGGEGSVGLTDSQAEALLRVAVGKDLNLKAPETPPTVDEVANWFLQGDEITISSFSQGMRKVIGAQIPVKLDNPDTDVDHMVLLSKLVPGSDGKQKVEIKDPLSGSTYLMNFEEFQQRLLVHAERPNYRGTI